MIGGGVDRVEHPTTQGRRGRVLRHRGDEIKGGALDLGQLGGQRGIGEQRRLEPFELRTLELAQHVRHEVLVEVGGIGDISSGRHAQLGASRSVRIVRMP
jgi:hypothetical protein